MAEVVLILGYSGSGKSTSLRNFKREEIGIFNVANKRLPFKNNLGVISTSNYQKIIAKLKENKVKRYVIDDSQYLMAFEMFGKVKQAGYNKFTDMALNFYNLIQTAKGLDDDTIVYFLHHLEKNEAGDLKIKTIGKMLDQQLTIEGLFSIVLGAVQMEKRYLFMTNGLEPFKSPIGMFNDQFIDNDLKMVDRTIREFWGIKDETIRPASKETENVDITIFDEMLSE